MPISARWVGLTTHGDSSVSNGQHTITVELCSKAGVTQTPGDLERNIALAGEPVGCPGIVK
jgi:hypothetical protein